MSDLAVTLAATVNQVLAVLTPDLARVLQAQVVLGDFDTASTDGQAFIKMPKVFCGVDLATNPAIAVGLAVHEAMHWFQPLAEMLKAEQQHGVPHWLANILLDIHGEATAACLFPAFAQPLAHTRRAVLNAYEQNYLCALQAAPNLPEQVANAALLARCCEPSRPFSLARAPFPVRDVLYQMRRAADLPTAELPALAVFILNRWPALRQPPSPATAQRLAQGSNAPAPQAALGPAAIHRTGRDLGHTITYHQLACSPRSSDAAALQLARQLYPRFALRPNAQTLCAPGTLDRLQAARGHPAPFTLALPAGRTAPARNVLLAVDVSSSMDDAKRTTALLAARALCLALEQASTPQTPTDVRGLLFSDEVWHTPNFSPEILFTNEGDGGTAFTWLTRLWREFPTHLVVLITDGAGTLPPLVARADQARTFGIAIPDAAPDQLAQICREVVTLHNVAHLPAALALLVPRRSVA